MPLQTEKAFSPMYRSELGNAISPVAPLHPENALSPI